VNGHWINGPGQAVVGPGFLKDHDLAVGDRVTLTMGGAPATVTIVGETWSYDPSGLMADWHTASVLDPGRGATRYEIGLRPGTNLASYIRLDDGRPASSALCQPGKGPVAQPEGGPLVLG
jgi:putative ABC transport system permease protein